MGENRLFGGFLSLSSSCRSKGSGGIPVAAVGYSEGSWVPEGDPSFFFGGGGTLLVPAPLAGDEPASGLLGEEVQLVILTSAVRVCSAGRRRREKLRAFHSPN